MMDTPHKIDASRLHALEAMTQQLRDISKGHYDRRNELLRVKKVLDEKILNFGQSAPSHYLVSDDYERKLNTAKMDRDAMYASFKEEDLKWKAARENVSAADLLLQNCREYLGEK